ncbi:dendritic arbor reduction protein 1-like isoform X1 [Hibiscus syriacus]|uniref:dendritic arbor reduction protein 1-like isoform X1 n=1 Tax=Hibiscus syriacus TaxID=106335 RepID=UPI0019222BF4|nr:dendritic arbor reduction protein 1-like isoform X1 [Hibiscus syriacus]
METAPPPPAAAPPLSSAINNSAFPAAAIPTTYADSIDSSPRSRHTDSWEDPAPAPALHLKLRLMCSYGGTIFPRPHDKTLSYIGGDTHMVVVDRHNSLASLHHRLSHSLLHGRPFTLKYQLPSEDLDSLISVTTDEDLENMIEEYDRTCSQTTSSSKSSRIRLFLFPLNPEEIPVSSHSVGPIINNSTKSDEWFLNALNGSGLINRGFSDSATNVNCLLGLDDDRQVNVVEAGLKDDGTGSRKNMNSKNQDVHSIPDSPMLETNSSFGSTSSSPSLANLPPIRVRPEDQREPKLMGIEERFAQFTLTSGSGGGPGGVKQQEEGFVALPTSPPMPVGIVVPGDGLGLTSGVVPGEYTNRGFFDDERSDHGAPVGYRKPAAPQSLPQRLQNQQKSGSGHELASPDSVSSDSSFTNPLSRQKPMIYQDPVVQISSGTNRAPANPVDPNSNPQVPMQQPVQDSGYILQQPQFDQQQQQQQQFLHAGAAHYIQHHPTGAVPISAYYPVYPSQQQSHHRHHTQIDQQYPLYYVPATQAQAYNMPVQQSSISEAATAIPSSRPLTTLAYSHMKNPPIAEPEMTAATGVYRITATGTPQLVQVPNNQHRQQYMGYSHIHHPSQSVAPTSAATASYAYEFTDPARGQVYYTRPLTPPPTMSSQYQTMTAASAVVLPDANSQLPVDNVKPQVRTSQPI